MKLKKLDKIKKEFHLIVSHEELSDYQVLLLTDSKRNPKRFEQAKFVSFLLYLMERKTLEEERY